LLASKAYILNKHGKQHVTKPEFDNSHFAQGRTEAESMINFLDHHLLGVLRTSLQRTRSDDFLPRHNGAETAEGSAWLANS